MTAAVNSISQNFEFPTHVQQKSNMNGKSVIVLESTKVSDFVAGAGPIKVPGLNAFATFAAATSTVVATVAVGIVSGSLKTAAITGVACGILTVVAYFVTPD